MLYVSRLRSCKAIEKSLSASGSVKATSELQNIWRSFMPVAMTWLEILQRNKFCKIARMLIFSWGLTSISSRIKVLTWSGWINSVSRAIVCGEEDVMLVNITIKEIRLCRRVFSDSSKNFLAFSLTLFCSASSRPSKSKSQSSVFPSLYWCNSETRLFRSVPLLFFKTRYKSRKRLSSWKAISKA